MTRGHETTTNIEITAEPAIDEQNQQIPKSSCRDVSTKRTNPKHRARETLQDPRHSADTDVVAECMPPSKYMHGKLDNLTTNLGALDFEEMRTSCLKLLVSTGCRSQLIHADCISHRIQSVGDANSPARIPAANIRIGLELRSFYPRALRKPKHQRPPTGSPSGKACLVANSERSPIADRSLLDRRTKATDPRSGRRVGDLPRALRTIPGPQTVLSSPRALNQSAQEKR